MASPPSFSAPALDYSALLTHLSRAPQLPSASSFRNQLLSHFSSRHALSTTSGEAEAEIEPDPDPWGSVQRFRPGSSTILLGAVPPHLLLPSARPEPAPSASAAGLWAAVHVYTSPGATNARVNIWLSSEPSLSSSGSASRSHSFEEEEQMLRHILHRVLPLGVASLRAAHALPPPASPGEAITATLCSLERTWLDLICSWARVECGALQPLRQMAQHAPAAAAETSASATPSGTRVTWANPCSTYQCDAAQLALPGAAQERWQIGRIESEGEMELIRTSNKIPFPREYVVSRSHLSVFIRDRLGPSGSNAASSEAEAPANDTYPTAQAAGAAAGFVYAHEELSLGALHVCAPYRRLPRSSSEAGIGRLLLAHMAPQLRAVIVRSLRRAGVEETDGDEACQISADTEVTSGAQGFFERCGMQRVRETAWVGIALLPGRPE